MQCVNLDSILVLPHASPPQKKNYKRHFENLGYLNMDQLITRQHWRIAINFVWYDRSNVVMHVQEIPGEVFRGEVGIILTTYFEKLQQPMFKIVCN